MGDNNRLQTFVALPCPAHERPQFSGCTSPAGSKIRRAQQHCVCVTAAVSPGAVLGSSYSATEQTHHQPMRVGRRAHAFDSSETVDPTEHSRSRSDVPSRCSIKSSICSIRGIYLLHCVHHFPDNCGRDGRTSRRRTGDGRWNSGDGLHMQVCASLREELGLCSGRHNCAADGSVRSIGVDRGAPLNAAALPFSGHAGLRHHARLLGSGERPCRRNGRFCL